MIHVLKVRVLIYKFALKFKIFKKYVNIIKSFLSTDLNTSVQHLFQNGSSVQFSYGTNIDFVFIKSYEQKQKYSNEMNHFYNYYKKSMK